MYDVSHTSHPHSGVPLVEQERSVELVGHVRADKLESERMREVAKKKMEEAEVMELIDFVQYIHVHVPQ